ncbi:MAG: type VI secretion system contractile sheath large subunit [Myxococcales bacterium]|nr:type VI secretion system contractile sheath large subunit [Myxococcales bacterium]
MKVSFTFGDSEAPSIGRMPLRVVVIADLLGGAGALSDGPLPPSLAIAEAADLDAALERVAPRLFFEVPDTLSGKGTIEINHEVKALRDLTPRALLRAAPQLERARALCKSLEAIRTGGTRRYGELAALADAHRDLAPLSALLEPCRALASGGGAPAPAEPAKPAAPAPAAATPAAGEDSALGRIMNMVEMPSSQERAAAAIDSMVSSIVPGGSRGAGAANGAGPSPLDAAIDAIGARFCAQLDQVMQHPQLLAVEGLWRGLRRLTRATAFRGENARIELVHMLRSDLVDKLAARLDELSHGEALPPTLVLAPYAFARPDDAATIERLAQIGEAFQTPVVASLSPKFFGADADSAPAMPYPEATLEKAAYDKLRALREKPVARWIALAFNALVARARYEAEASRVGYDETRRDGSAVPLIDASLAVGERVVASVGRYGWPTQLSGREDGLLEDLSLRETRNASGKRVMTPLEANVDSDLARDLAESGVICLEAAPDSDRAFVRRAPTLSKAAREQARRGEALPYQLLASRLAHAVDWFFGERAGASDDVAVELERFLQSLVADSGGGAFVEVKRHADRLEVDLRTGRAVLGGASIGFNLPAA